VLTDANPWWRAAAARTDPTAWTRDHRLLQDRANHDLGFRPTVLGDIATGPVTDQLAVLTGPRRIGKSVALLDTAAALCARTDVDPRQVIHLPCDGLRDRDLRRSLTLGRELTRSVDVDGPRRRVWLLDEISGV
jgi:predicted AAA+ superfamily ATPase